MTLVAREDLSVPISDEMAEKMGLYPGTRVQWERTADGGYALRPALTRQEAARQMHRMPAHTLTSGESAVTDLIFEREEDAIRDERA